LRGIEKKGHGKCHGPQNIRGYYFHVPVLN